MKFQDHGNGSTEAMEERRQWQIGNGRKEARERGRVISSRLRSPRPSREKVELAGAIEDIANRSG